MPSNPSNNVKGARETRAWGTRYASLPLSPTLSQVALRSSSESSDGQSESGDLSLLKDGAPSSVDKGNSEQNRKLSWADDDVDLPSTVLFPLKNGGTTPTRPSPPRGKMPHDASVFIRKLVPSFYSDLINHNPDSRTDSLPADIEHEELVKALQQHLSALVNIQNINIVDDQKGSVNAFVQCEVPFGVTIIITICFNAALQNFHQAKNLIANSPQPFEGRILRYESARAHRTLNISYCSPKRFVPEAKDSSGMWDD